ncbi:MAG: hypothetical protein ACK5L5_11275 [Bacteroidales bacterium]
MAHWTILYKELAERIKEQIPEVEWIDLWHEQVSYLTEELPFPTPAVFIAFNTNECSDIGLLIQNCDIQVDFYLFYETFSDTYMNSYNKDRALSFLDLLDRLHLCFHGVSGEKYNTMRRSYVSREDSGDA